MLDQERIEGDPVPLVHDLPEARLRLLRGTRPHHPEPVRDPMDMGVDGDRRDPVAEDEDAVRGLWTDAGKRQQFLHRPGHDAREAGLNLAGRVPDDPGLDTVEAGRADQWLDLARRSGRERRRVRESLEEPGARDIGVLVAGPLGQDRPDQDLERVLRVVAEVRRPPIPSAVEGGESVEDQLPVNRRARVGPHLTSVARADVSG